MAQLVFCAQCGAETHPGDARCPACQHPLDLLSGSGSLLQQRYEILAELGRGGFGAVYKARDTQEQGRLVAVKQINLQGLSSQEIIEATDAFNREAEILSTLSHPLLPRIFARFSDPEHWYLVMTLIEGQTLDEYLQQKQVTSLPARAGLPLEETLDIALALCDALGYLHAQQPPVIFRDLKPGNIMRTRGGKLYLIDFGIARRFKPGQAKDTIPFGSPGFAAPEQYGKAQTTPRADLYSLGALLSCLLTGDDPSEHPFHFPPLRQYGIDGIGELDALIQRLVALDPQQRPANVEEVQAELKRIQQLAVQAHKQFHMWVPPQGQTPPSFATNGGKQQHMLLTPTGTQKPVRKTSRRRVLTVSLIIGGTLATFGAINALTGPQQPALPSTTDQGNSDDQTATAQSENATATATGQIPAVPVNGPTYWSPDLSHAAVANLEKGQIEIYKVLNQQVVQSMNLQNIKMPANFSNPTVQWSANNSSIVAQSDTGMIYAWNAQTGQKLFTFAAAVAGYTAPGSISGSSITTILAWSPDGQYCAIGYAKDDTIDQNGNYLHTSLTILQTSTGQPYFQTSFPAYNSGSNNGGSNNLLAWSPGSRYLAFPDAAGWPDGPSWKANIWDRETNQISKSFSGTFPSNPYSTSLTSIVWSPRGEKLATTSYDALWINRFGDSQPGGSLTILYDDSALTSGPVWSPNEKYVAILTNQSALATYDTSNGAVVFLTNDNSPSNLAAIAWSADSKSITVVDNDNILSTWTVE